MTAEKSTKDEDDEIRKYKAFDNAVVPRHLHCKHCGEHIKRVTGGHGPMFIHEDGYVVCRMNSIAKIEHGQGTKPTTICRAELEKS